MDDGDWRMIVCAYCLNTASYSIVPLVYAQLPFGAAQTTLSSAIILSAFVVGWYAFNEVPKMHQIGAAMIIISGIVLLHFRFEEYATRVDTQEI